MNGNTFPNNAIGTKDASDLVFITGGTNAGNERMRITQSGNIAVANNNQILLSGTRIQIMA